MNMTNNSSCKLVILSSGYGSNLQAIIDKLHERHGIQIKAIVSDKPSRSIQRALNHNIACLFLPKDNFQDRNLYDKSLANLIAPFEPDLVVLSGFMRILSTLFISKYQKKIINIHPSLLPKYKGLHTHQRVIDSKDNKHGTTIHYVDESLDGGKIIAQKEIEVMPLDTADTLEKKIKMIEHEFYPQIIKKIVTSDY